MFLAPIHKVEPFCYDKSKRGRANRSKAQNKCSTAFIRQLYERPKGKAIVIAAAVEMSIVMPKRQTGVTGVREELIKKKKYNPSIRLVSD